MTILLKTKKKDNKRNDEKNEYVFGQ
jgi:hypothetical protein